MRLLGLIFLSFCILGHIEAIDQLLDPYETLGIPPGADENMVKKAYRKLAFEWHPDRWQGRGASEADRKKAEEQFKQISHAYGLITNPQSITASITAQTVFDLIDKNDQEAIRKLLKNESDWRDFVLRYAVIEKNNSEIAQIAINAGADVNETVKMVMPKTQYADKKEFEIELLLFALGNKSWKIAQQLIKAGAKLDIVHPYTKDTPLKIAILFGQDDILQNLIEKGVDVNDKLTLNVKKEKPFNIYHVDEYKELKIEPLLLAINVDKWNMVPALIEAGANVNIIRSDGFTPLILAILKDRSDFVRDLLAKGAKSGKIEIEQVEKEGTHSKTIKVKFTPLMMAIKNEQWDVIKALIEGGTDVNVTLSENGITPLMLVAQAGKLELVRDLIAKGAMVNAATRGLLEQERFFTGITALMLAAENGHSEIVEELIKNNANVHATRGDGETARTLAEKNGYTKIAQSIPQWWHKYLSKKYVIPAIVGGTALGGYWLHKRLIK